MPEIENHKKKKEKKKETLIDSHKLIRSMLVSLIQIGKLSGFTLLCEML